MHVVASCGGEGRETAGERDIYLYLCRYLDIIVIWGYSYLSYDTYSYVLQADKTFAESEGV